MADNHIGVAGAMKLSSALCHTPSVSLLQLTGNPFLTGCLTVAQLSKLSELHATCTSAHMAQHLNFVQIPSELLPDSAFHRGARWTIEPLLQWIEMRQGNVDFVALGITILAHTYDSNSIPTEFDWDKQDALLINALAAVLVVHRAVEDIVLKGVNILHRVIHNICHESQSSVRVAAVCDALKMLALTATATPFNGLSAQIVGCLSRLVRSIGYVKQHMRPHVQSIFI
jgi:hypothetical protein